jgi:hypothetical protein
MKEHSLDGMDSIMSRSRTTVDMVAYRGLRRDFKVSALGLKEGDRWVDKGFVSTSLDKNQASGFGGEMMEIRVPSGSRALYLGADTNAVGGDQQELILDRDSVFVYRGKTGSLHQFELEPRTEIVTAPAAAKTSAVSGTDVIRVSVSANPKKAGSAAAARFALYKDGMTVDDYVKAAGSRKQALVDMAWDRKRGFIAFEPPAGAAPPRAAPPAAPPPSPPAPPPAPARPPASPPARPPAPASAPTSRPAARGNYTTSNLQVTKLASGRQDQVREFVSNVNSLPEAFTRAPMSLTKPKLALNELDAFNGNKSQARSMKNSMAWFTWGRGPQGQPTRAIGFTFLSSRHKSGAFSKTTIAHEFGHYHDHFNTTKRIASDDPEFRRLYADMKKRVPPIYASRYKYWLDSRKEAWSAATEVVLAPGTASNEISNPSGDFTRAATESGLLDYVRSWYKQRGLIP